MNKSNKSIDFNTKQWRIAEINAEIALRLKEATKAGPNRKVDARIEELRAERDRLVS